MASGILEPTRTRDAQSLRNAPEKGRTVESRRQEPPESTPDRPASRQDGARDRSRPPSLLRRHLSWGTLALGLTSAAAFGGYSYWTSYIQPFESTDDAFVDARSFSVAPKVAGYVVDAPVTDNQHVAAGATLFQIDKRDYDTALAQANAQVEAGEAAIQTIDAQIDMQKAEIEVAQAQVTQAQAALALRAAGFGALFRSRQERIRLCPEPAVHHLDATAASGRGSAGSSEPGRGQVADQDASSATRERPGPAGRGDRAT